MTSTQRVDGHRGGAVSLALACHVGPDGDALGSMLALHHLCPRPRQAVGRVVVRAVPGRARTTVPARPRPGDPAGATSRAAPDVMVTFDCGSLARLGDWPAPAQGRRELIVLDHHVANDRYGTINVDRPDAAATAVVVRRAGRRLGWALTRDAAVCLYTGLVTDTGRFQYTNTTPEVFVLAEELSASTCRSPTSPASCSRSTASPT